MVWNRSFCGGRSYLWVGVDQWDMPPGVNGGKTLLWAEEGYVTGKKKVQHLKNLIILNKNTTTAVIPRFHC